MSLIYEALRKSEQQRRLGEMPTLSTPPLVVVRRRRRPGPYLAAAAAVLAIGTAAWWLGRSSQRAEVPAVAVVDARAPDAPPPAIAVPAADAARGDTAAAPAPAAREAATPAPTPTAPAVPDAAPASADDAAVAAGVPPALQEKLDRGEVFANSPEQLKPLPPTREPAYVPPEAALPEPLPDPENDAGGTATVTAVPAPAPAAAAPAPAATPAPPAPMPSSAASVPAPPTADAAVAPAAPDVATTSPAVATTDTVAPAATSPLPYLFELPLGTRRELPPLKINMHVWSPEPARRFVIVDGTRAAEGGAVSDGLTVAEIRADGVVLEFRGQRFLLPRSGG